MKPIATDTNDFPRLRRENWVKGVSVADGEIVLEVKSRGFMLIVK